MTNETTYSEKGRAVVLAALMVLSVVAMAAVLPGAAVASHDSGAADLHSGETYWAGQDVTFAANSGSSATWNVYGVESDTDTDFQTQINVENGNATLDTSKLDTGEYNEFAIRNNDGQWVNFNNGDASASDSTTATSTAFTVLEQDLSADFQSDTVSDLSTEVSIDISDVRGEQDLIVEADGLKGEDLENIFESSSLHGEDQVLLSDVQNDETLTGNFSGVDTGNYTFTFTSADTGASASDNVEVVDGGNVNAAFTESSVSETLGDVAEITVELENTETADITVGSESDGWMANASVTDNDDDGEVTVLFNTANAGNTTVTKSDVLYTADDDSDAVNVDTHQTVDTNNNVLATGSYDMKLEVQGMQTARGTVNLQEGSIDSATTAKLNGNAEFADAGELAELLDDSSEVAQGDKAVVAVEASGIFGYEDRWDTQGIDLTIEQSEPAKNRQPVTVSSGDYEKYSDSDTNTVYYVIDTTDVINSEDRIENGEEFTFSLSVTADENYYLSEDAEVSSTYTVNERSVSFAQDEYSVANEAGQEISGTSNLASGAEVDVTAQTGGDNAFFNQKSAEVGENGDWTATLDFSDHSVGTEFDLTVDDPESEASDDATGVVGEDNGEDDSTINVEGNAPSSVEVNESATLDVTVTNNADSAQTVDYHVDIGDETVDNQSLELEAGEEFTESYDIDTSAEGDISWGVHAGDATDEGTVSVSAENTDDSGNNSGDSGSDSSGTEDSGTEDSGTEDSGNDDGDDDGTPGFGVGVALVALLGAAMLALRRQN